MGGSASRDTGVGAEVVFFAAVNQRGWIFLPAEDPVAYRTAAAAASGGGTHVYPMVVNNPKRKLEPFAIDASTVLVNSTPTLPDEVDTVKLYVDLKTQAPVAVLRDRSANDVFPGRNLGKLECVVHDGRVVFVAVNGLTPIDAYTSFSAARGAKEATGVVTCNFNVMSVSPPSGYQPWYADSRTPVEARTRVYIKVARADGTEAGGVVKGVSNNKNLSLKLAPNYHTHTYGTNVKTAYYTGAGVTPSRRADLLDRIRDD